MKKSERVILTGKTKAKATAKDQSDQPRETIQILGESLEDVRDMNCVIPRDPKVLEPKFTELLDKITAQHLAAMTYLKLANNRLIQIINQIENSEDLYTFGLTERITIFLEDQK